MQPNAEWSSDFFSGFIIDAQRRINSEAETQAEAEFLLQALDLPAGARVADVPCGNGRLSLALAAHGYRMTGVDLSVDLLGDARRGAAERGLNAVFEQRDMRDLPWPGEFDGAFCFGNSFGYFDSAGNRGFLHAIHDILKPGGRFVLNTHFVCESLFSQPLGRRWYPFDDLIFLHETSYDPASARLTSEYILIHGGQTERKRAVYQMVTYRELMSTMEDVDFVQLEGYGSLKCEPFQLGSPGLWIAARRGPAKDALV